MEPAASIPHQMPAPVGSGNQAGLALGNYVRGVVKEKFVPMAGSCYEEYLTKHPGKGGRAVISVKIVGDPSVGGVVDSATLAPSSTLRDDDFSTCVVESMMAMEFDAPPAGGEVTFEYPFDFAPDPPPAPS